MFFKNLKWVILILDSTLTLQVYDYFCFVTSEKLYREKEVL